MRKLFFITFTGICLLFIGTPGVAQRAQDSILQDATLQQCVKYALKHYPLIQQSYLDQEITEREIRSKLADWFPQIGLSANYQNNFQLPSTYFNGEVIKNGTYNTSGIGLAGTQNIFNRDLLLASRSANDFRRQSRQATITDKINVVVGVSKAFYDVLLTRKQIDLLEDDIVRLTRSLKDAYNQYQGGIVDKIDYKQATISLNNSKAEKKTNEELLKGKVAYLKELMGYSAQNDLQPQYDSLEVEHEAIIDTNLTVNYANRIEYQSLQTSKKLQEDNLLYARWAFLPAVSAFGNYNLAYLGNQFPGFYGQNFPSSYAGIQFSFPIFQGTKRIQNIRIAELQVKRSDWDIINVENTINTQFVQALSNYKGYLNDYYILRDNLALAQEVYNTVELQYKSGIKAYLDVITAETALRSAQLNYTNALFQLLISKVDVQQAIGTISIN